MLKNYFRVAYRNMARQKGYSFITVLGLAIGMACAILVGLWIMDELSFDRFHAKADRIYRLSLDAEIGGQTIRGPLSNAPSAPTLMHEFPEVVDAVRFADAECSVRYGQKEFRRMGVYAADASVFDVFSFRLLQGDPETALEAAYTVVLTESTARRIFDEEDPIGKTLVIGGDQDYTVTGIMADVPSNSHLQFEILGSFETFYAENPGSMERWISFSYFTYLLLAEGADYRAFETKLASVVDTHMGEDLAAIGGRIDFFLQPLTSIYLHSDLEYEPRTGSIGYVYLFGALGLLVLVIAGINFVNLITARAITRAKEVGLRKTLGAQRKWLVGQFLGESVIYALVSLVLAVVLVEAAAPLFSEIAERPLSLHWASDPWVIPALLVLALVLGLAAGAYPALHLSAFRPARAVKGEALEGPSGSRLRRLLVLVQLSGSVALIVATLVAGRQLDYMRSQHLGYDQERVIVIPEIDVLPDGRLDVLKAELERLPAVTSMGLTSSVPGTGANIKLYAPEGYPRDDAQGVFSIAVDGDFFSTLGLSIVEGRDFSNDLATEERNLIINETAAHEFGWEEPVGKTVERLIASDTVQPWIRYRVIGVVDDFHFSSLHRAIAPAFLRYEPEDCDMLCVRLGAGRIPQQLEQIRQVWTDLFPNRTCDYFFLGEPIEQMYESEERLGKIMSCLAVLAVIIAGMGLIGLSAYAAERRTREIGIRKVLGSTAPGIVALLAREFVVLVLLANVIAVPLMVWAVNRWLQGFAYRAELGWTVYAVSGGAVLVIALLAVSYQAVRAALSNPIDSLRYE